MWVKNCIIAPPFVDGWIKQKHDFGRHCSKNCKPQQVGVVKNRAMETKKPTAFGNRHRKKSVKQASCPPDRSSADNQGWYNRH